MLKSRPGILSIVMLTAAGAGALESPVALANVELSLARAPGDSDVQLQWSGGQPRFAVYRSDDAELVGQPVSWMGDTNDSQWIDATSTTPIVFYKVISEGSCSPGLILCQGACVDPNSDDEHCGGCDHACNTYNAADAYCNAGTCLASCFSGYGDCGQPAPPTPDDGCETDLDNDPASCGACGATCPPGWACVSGMCLEP